MARCVELANTEAPILVWEELHARYNSKNRFKAVRIGTLLAIGDVTESYQSLAEFAYTYIPDPDKDRVFINDGFIFEFDTDASEVLLLSEPLGFNIAPDTGMQVEFPRYGGEVRSHEILAYQKQLAAARRTSCLYLLSLVDSLPGNPRLLYSIAPDASDKQEYRFEARGDIDPYY